MQERLRADGIVKRFVAGFGGCRAAAEVLRGVSLRVEAGEVVGIRAARGAGKSTLLRCLAGVLRPDAGSVAWLGGPPGGERPVGVALAADHALAYGFLTAREALEFHALAHDLPIGDRGRRVREVLACVGLARRAEVRIALLDGVDLLRLRLAEALLSEPRVLLVDAPHLPLAPADADGVALILAGVAESGAGVVVAARRDEMLVGASRHLVLRWGRLEEPWAPVSGIPVLEIEVDDVERALGALAGLGAAGRPRERAVRVPLDVGGAEAVLAECLRSGVRVFASRIVEDDSADLSSGRRARVAERWRM